MTKIAGLQLALAPRISSPQLSRGASNRYPQWIGHGKTMENHGKTMDKPMILRGKSMVSGEDVPFSQSIDIHFQHPLVMSK